jgi:putative solute:sodium symporter small subunit
MIEICSGVALIISAVAFALGLLQGWVPFPVGNSVVAITVAAGGALILRGLYRLSRKRAPDDGHGLRSIGLMGLIAGLAAAIALAAPVLSEPLNLISAAGFPLGFYLLAQGALISFVILQFVFAVRQDRIDDADRS